MGNPSQYEKMMEAKNKLDDDHGWFYHTHLVSVGDYKRSIRPFEPEQLIQDMSLLSLKYLRARYVDEDFSVLNHILNTRIPGLLLLEQNLNAVVVNQLSKLIRSFMEQVHSR